MKASMWRRRITILLATSLLISCKTARAEDFTNAIRAYLQQRVEVEKRDVGMVVGLLDDSGSSVVACGKLEANGDQEVNGDTVFALHSMTVTFTGLLLQHMIERGEMKLDDPVALYLPKSVKIPTHNGKEITLRHLVTETAGLPRFTENLGPTRAEDFLAGYTAEKMYAFLSGYDLARDPGTHYEHGGLDMGLLGHAIELKAGTNFEALVLERICRPLGMEITRFTLTPELKSRLVTEHNELGYPLTSAAADWGVLRPLGGLLSTANDLLKYVSALGLKPSRLTPLMQNNEFFPWTRTETTIQFGGGGCTFAGYDKARRRRIVVLSSTVGVREIRRLGSFLLESEWQSDRQPKAGRINSQVFDAYAGQYRRTSDWALGMFALQQRLLKASGAAVYLPAGLCLAALAVVLWHAGSWQRRWIILGGTGLAIGLVAPLLVMVSSRVFCAQFRPGIGIRREGERLFAEPTGVSMWPSEDWRFVRAMGSRYNLIDVSWPAVRSEVLPESETRFFERLSGTPLVFSCDAQGKATALTVHYHGTAVVYKKTSDQPPSAPAPVKRPVVVRLSPELLEACVGQYQLGSNAVVPHGGKLTLWREGEHLAGKFTRDDIPENVHEIYPESETNFFIKTDGAQIRFIKNDKGEVTGFIAHNPGERGPGLEAKKLPQETKWSPTLRGDQISHKDNR